MQRHYCRLLAASVLLSCPGMAAAQGDPFTLLFGDEDALDASSNHRAGRDDVRFVGLRLGGLKLSQTLTAYAYDDGLCVLPGALFSAIEAPIEVTLDGASGWFLSPDRTIEIDIAFGTAVLNTKTSLDLAEHIHETPEGWCLSLPALSQILPIDFAYDSSSLTLAMDPRETLPLEAKLEREALRAQTDLYAGRIQPNYRKIENPYRWLSFPTADINLDLRASSDSALATQGQIELSGDVLWTTARVRSVQNEGGDMGVRATLERVFGATHNMWMPKQIRVGDVASLNQPLMETGATGRGVVITNRPAFAADVFDLTDIRGPLPSGWEAELYRDSQLVDFVTEPDDQGEYHFDDVEILPGYNRYTVKLFGPFGETDTREVKFFAGSEMHPENTVQYELAVLEEGITVDGNEAASRSPVAAASVSAGLSDRISARLDVRAALHAPIVSTASIYAASGDVNGVARLQVTGANAPALEVGAVRLFEDRTSLEARYFRFGDGGILDSDTSSSLQQSLQIEHNTTLPVSTWGLPLQSRIAWNEHVSGDEEIKASARVSSSFQGWRWTHLAHLAHQRTLDKEETSAGGQFGFSRSLSGMRIRGGIDYEVRPELEAKSIDFGVQRRLGDEGFAQFNLARDMSEERTTASASFARTFGDVTLSTNAGMDDRGGWTAGLRLSTALFFDRRSNSYRTGPSGMSRTGALRANVFDDLNEDGVLGVGDEPVSGARFILDRSIRREETDTDGAVTMGSVESHRPLDLEVSLGTLSDPFLQAG